jgi:nucleotide-binding universal stress UspA family protein
MSGDIETILAATDLSEASEAATTYAFWLARSLRARLYLLHVVPESDVAVMAALRGHLQSEISREALSQPFYAEAETRLTALVDSAKAHDLVAECLVVTGQPASEIVGWAIAKQAQIIIMGTHGRSSFDRFLLGSVAEHVLRLASCAVLVVPAHKVTASVPA